MSKKSASEQPVILFAEECDRGILREENQDAVLHVSIPLGDLLLVADGIGGYAGGATASRMVVENFYTYLAGLPQDYPVDNAIRGAAARANTQIMAAASIPGTPNHHMGSTVVVAVVQQQANGISAWIGHIGDSRAYLMCRPPAPPHHRSLRCAGSAQPQPDCSGRGSRPSRRFGIDP